MSTATRGLSFGKFLELCFSSHSAASRLSKCGHSLHRDCLRFYGLGSKVAMFRYSSVEIYTACKPPPVLEFHNPHGQEWLKREAHNVLARAHLFFSKVAKLLQKLKPKCSSPILKKYLDITGLFKEISEVEEMLTQEKTEFEASLLKAINHSQQLGITMHEVLGLNCLDQELLLEIYVWDCRLHQLLQHKRAQQDKNGSTCNMYAERKPPENGERILEAASHILIEDESSSSSGNYHAKDTQTELEIESTDDSGDTSSRAQNFPDAWIAEIGSLAENVSDRSTFEVHSVSFLDRNHCPKPADDVSTPTESSNNGQEAHIPTSDEMMVNHSIQITREPYIYKVGDLEQNTDDETASSGEMSAMSMSKEYLRMSQEFCSSRLEDSGKWVWAPFSELRRAYKKGSSWWFIAEV